MSADMSNVNKSIVNSDIARYVNRLSVFDIRAVLCTFMTNFYKVKAYNLH